MDEDFRPIDSDFGHAAVHAESGHGVTDANSGTTEVKTDSGHAAAATPTGNFDYVPPYKVLAKVVVEKPHERTVTIPKPVFEMLLQHVLNTIGFDEDWYRSTYKDVATAIKSGSIPNGFWHFARSGYREGRLPRKFTVDEVWYCSRYPDVNESIKAGRISTARDHYNSVGYLEGRYPSADAEKTGRSWFERTVRKEGSPAS